MAGLTPEAVAPSKRAVSHDKGESGRAPVSVIVCSRNRPRLLADTVTSTVEGEVHPAENVIVDQSDSPNDEAIPRTAIDQIGFFDENLGVGSGTTFGRTRAGCAYLSVAKPPSGSRKRCLRRGADDGSRHMVAARHHRWQAARSNRRMIADGAGLRS